MRGASGTRPLQYACAQSSASSRICRSHPTCSKMRRASRDLALDRGAFEWRPALVERGIANILHRETIAVIVGSQTFERGERCFAAKRVQRVEASRGELRGVV